MAYVKSPIGKDFLDEELWDKAKAIYLGDPTHGYTRLTAELDWHPDFTSEVVNNGVAPYPSLKSLLTPEQLTAVRVGKNILPAGSPEVRSFGRAIEKVTVKPPPKRPSLKASSNALAELDSLTPIAALNAALEQVQMDLAKALPRESALVRSYREQAIGLSAAANQCVRAAQMTIEVITTRIMNDAAEGRIGSEQAAIVRVSKLLKIIKMCATQGELAFKLQRVITGLPTSISATEVTETRTDMADLARITESLERLRGASSSVRSVIDVPVKVRAAAINSDASDDDDADDDEV